MAKILIADDNSNIQKMVVLALKDQGIDVVAVGNGEAAVRKIADVRPDLVLADVFMPVRNGYEVCKFVKDHATLSHVPVILLVGAFDPLDEQEAQRVGADGVLKKPFVPPDPLISMVKSALARAGVSLEGSTAVPPPPVPGAVAPKPQAVPSLKVAPPAAPVLAPVPEEDFVVASSAPSHVPLNLGSGAQPVAFGNLLDSPGLDEEAVFSVSPSAAPVLERDFSHADAADEPEEEEEEKSASWRLTSLPETLEEAPAGQKDWREAAFAGIGEEKSHAPGWAPSVEQNSLAISEEEAAALERERQVFASPGAANALPDYTKEISSILPEVSQPVATVSAVEEKPAEIAPVAPVVEELPAVAEIPAPGISVATPETPAMSAVLNPFANSSSEPANHPWEAALNHANELASSWDAMKLPPAEPLDSSVAVFPADPEPVPAAPEISPEIAQETAPAIEIEQEAVSAYSAESFLPPAVTEDLKEEVAAVTETQAAAHEEVVAPEAPQDVAVPAATPTTDELVAQVLAKMNPEVLQAVTREILKPIVQAMIKERLEKK